MMKVEARWDTLGIDGKWKQKLSSSD